MNKKISIDKKKCTGCGLCIKDCITSCIELNKNNIPHFKTNGKKSCIACQHCMAICPMGALSFGDKKPEESSYVNYGDSDDVLNLIKSRRSVRLYKNESIPQELLSKIKEMLPYTPTGININSLHFSIVETKEKLDKIRKLSYKKIMKSTDESPYTSMIQTGYSNGQDIIYRGATAMVVVCTNDEKIAQSCKTVDPIIALSYLELYAQSLGLGTVWCGIATEILKNFDDIRDLLRIPDGFSIGYVMLLGIPDVKYFRTPQPEPYSMSIIK